jgi:hypothetical protein
MMYDRQVARMMRLAGGIYYAQDIARSAPAMLLAYRALVTQLARG